MQSDPITQTGDLSYGLQADIAYGDRPRNRLDLYLPTGVEQPPIVMFVHGGRWFRNGKEQLQLFDRHIKLTEAGFAVASINHTYSSEAIWPAQQEDVMAALRFLKNNGDKFGYDASRLAVWGQSSGGHLALWATLLAAQDKALDVDALVSWYAVSNLSRIGPDREADEVPGGNERHKEPSPETQLIGMSVPENREAADAASPERYAAALAAEVELPPMLLMHGDRDWIMSPLQTRRMYDTLLARDPQANVQLQMVEGGSHGGDAFGPVVADVIKFLRMHLGLVQ